MSYSVEPMQEEDVVAIFNQLLGSGKLLGYDILHFLAVGFMTVILGCLKNT